MSGACHGRLGRQRTLKLDAFLDHGCLGLVVLVERNGNDASRLGPAELAHKRRQLGVCNERIVRVRASTSAARGMTHP